MLRMSAVFGFGCAVALLSSTRSAAMQSPLTSGANVNWPGYNNASAADRYVAISQIDRSNVSGLHVLCSAGLGTQLSFQTGPIVINGVLYATTKNQTYAIDATTCATRWINTYTLPKSVSHNNRGAAYSDGRIYRGFADGHMIAIDASTGATIWNQSIIGSGSLEFIAGAPVAFKTSIIAGTAGGDNGQPCHVVAMNAATGAIIWTVQTVPNIGAPGSSTWKGAARIAGGGTWSALTIDPATGQLFVPVGNPGPDYDVRKRIGSDVYTVSVLDLDAATGAMVGAVQTNPEDDHDWDQGAAPAIVTLSGGAKIALIAGKDGYLRSVNASSLQQNWQTAVTTITNATAPIVTGGTHFCPAGGTYWNGPAYSPVTGLAYVNAADWCKTVKRTPSPAPYQAGQEWLGTTDGDGVKDAARAGWLSAVDASTGAVAWTYKSTLPLVAGVTPTAGGLVFDGDLSGNVLAFNSATGALLQTVSTGLPIGGGVISYEVAGKQYLAISAGLNSMNFGTPSTSSEIVILGL